MSEDAMKLYEISWGIYPRRVGVYLAEKGISGIERIDVPVSADTPSPILGDLTPSGTVPALAIDGDRVIGSSLAIIEYLEDCFPSPNMMGATPSARARTRELVAVLDEATVHMGTWVRNASPLFAGRVPQNREAAKVAAQYYDRAIHMLDKWAGLSSGPWLAGPSITIADCIAFSALQFAREVYSVPIPDDCPALTSWFDRFSTRPSATAPAYPPEILAVARGLVEQTMS